MKTYSASNVLIVCITVGIYFVLIQAQNASVQVPPPDQVIDTKCLNCLCEASSNCNASIGCFHPTPDSSFCGAFGISREYWIDAGRPVIKNDNPRNPEAFENCVKDLHCSATTVSQYMNKFFPKGDCNNDGNVDCNDFAIMHTRGGYDCSNASAIDTLFDDVFTRCMGGF